MKAGVLIAWLVLSSAGLGDDSPLPQPPRWVPVAKAHMDEVRVIAANDAARQFRRIEEPVFHHVQSVRGKSVGSVFVWVDDQDRPVAVGDAFFFESPSRTQMYNEWHSVASEPIRVQWNGRSLIAPSGPGVRWTTIAAAPAPAESAVARSRQIRQLSQRFAAHLVNRENDRYELRLLPTPLHRYDAGEKQSDAGALFAFCQETDPELFLLIESHREESGEATWRYAVAEFSNLNLYLRLDDVEVWRAAPPEFSSSGPHSGGYLQDVTLPKEMDEPTTNG